MQPREKRSDDIKSLTGILLSGEDKDKEPIIRSGAKKQPDESSFAKK